MTRILEEDVGIHASGGDVARVTRCDSSEPGAVRADLSSLGVDVVGISPDRPDAQSAFDRKYQLGFPLLADPDHAVAEAWGVWGEKSKEGRTYEGIIRSSFLVDADGRIREAWYQVAPERTVPLALEAISAA